ncbi:MAG: DUF3180 domain-containing protein [Cumulibacter sp.]
MNREVKATATSTLLALFVGAGVIGYVLVRQWYGDIPPLNWYMPIWAGVLALAEAVFGLRLKDRILRRRDAEPIEPIVAARAVALAKASAYVGALLAGAWTGFAAYTAGEWGFLASAGRDTVICILGAVFAAGLAAAGLWLEHCCRVPRDPNDPK